jgi:CRISP-associated protein Cas1
LQLILNTFGASLRKKDNMFLIRSGERQVLMSPKKVQSIVLTTGVHLSTDAIRLALEHHIDIALLDKYGEPYGRFWHTRLGSTNRLRRRLLEIAETEEGVSLAGEWVQAKIGNQAGLIRELARTRPDRAEELEAVAGRLDKMADIVAGLKGTAIDELRGSLMGLEGVAGREYFAALSLALPERFRFRGRSRSPAKDEFNSLINYAYGVLYSLVERACLLCGLDPCIGLMHTDNYNKPSLVYDLIEFHRVHAERVVINLFAARKVKAELFEQVDGGFRLNAEGRALLLNALNEHLDRMKHHGRRRLKIRDTIVYECQRLAGRLLRGLDDDGEVDLSVYDLAAELGGESSIPSSSSAGEPGSCEDRVAIESAAVDGEAGDREDDPARRADPGSPPGPVVATNGQASQPGPPFDEDGDSDVDLGHV